MATNDTRINTGGFSPDVLVAHIVGMRDLRLGLRGNQQRLGYGFEGRISQVLRAARGDNSDSGRQ